MNIEAYTDGRNSVYDGKVMYPCDYTDSNDIASWKAGVRSAMAEDRLNADPEWDND